MLEEVFKVSDEDSTISFGVTLVFIWSDERIKFSNTSGKKGYRSTDQSLLEHIWRPKYQIISATTMDKDYVPSYVRLNVTSAEVFSLVLRRHIKPTITCKMKFNLYPFDEHICDFIILAFDPLPEMVFSNIKQKRLYDPASKDNVLLDYEITLTNLPGEKREIVLGSEYELLTPHSKRHLSWSSGGFQMHLKRRWLRIILIYFLPSSLCVIASWSSFLIDTGNISARCSLLASVFLSLTTLLISAILSSPRVGSITALGAWILIQYVFITVEIAIFCYILVIKRYRKVNMDVRKMDRRFLVLVMIAYIIVSVMYVVVINIMKYY